MSNAKITYAILSSHRTGSSLLCTLLTQTGVAGKPNEYFSHWRGRSYNHYDLSDYPAYIKRIVAERQTSNSVFGMKMMAGEDGFAGILHRLETVPAYAGLTDPEKIRTFFPNCKFIYLTRRNKVAQAVSWWKAVQTDYYHTVGDQPASDIPIKYDFDAIRHLFTEATIQECAHQAFLDKMRAVPLTFVYEDFIQNQPETVTRILNFLGIDDAYIFQPSSLRQMADATSQAWIERFRIELQADWENKRW